MKCAKKFVCGFLALVLICTMGMNLAGCRDNRNDPPALEGQELFIHSRMGLAVALFQASVKESRNENVLISPVSVQLALAMVANGANGQTREEMETLLGGGMTLEALNESLHTYVSSLPSEEKYKLHIANSIWYRANQDRIEVYPEFIQYNENYYGAQIFPAEFDQQTLNQINAWVNENTDGMIPQMLDHLCDDDYMFLINAMAFDSEWAEAYAEKDIYTSRFTNISGDEKLVKMMRSEEYAYLQDEYATGFMKAYSEGKYSFAALLPNEGVDLYSYISGLTGEGLLNTLNNAKAERGYACLPKFSYEYELLMNDALSDLGMPTAFDKDAADFSKLGYKPNGTNINIDKVEHKTCIQVDERGTKAGAATSVGFLDGASSVKYKWSVALDRPFVYMIIDNQTKLPIFMGVVTDIPQA